MFKEKRFIYQERAPRSGKEKLPYRPKPDTSASRREIMPLSPTRATAYKMIDDVFGKANREKIIKSIDPQSLQAAIEDMSKNFLMPPHNLKYKGILRESGEILLTFDDNGKELKYGFTTVFYITDEKMKELLAMTKTPTLNMRALERRADVYIMGRVVEMILNYGPDEMPDDILDRILKTGLISNIRRAIIEAYKRGREYKMTTSENGFTLETDDPKDPGLPAKIYDMEKFWRELKLMGGENTPEPEPAAIYPEPLSDWERAITNPEEESRIRKMKSGEQSEPAEGEYDNNTREQAEKPQGQELEAEQKSPAERRVVEGLKVKAVAEAEDVIEAIQSMVGEGTFDDLSDKVQKEIFDNLNIAADNLVEQFPKLRELDDIVQEMQNDMKNIALRERGQRKYEELIISTASPNEAKAYHIYGALVEGLLGD